MKKNTFSKDLLIADVLHHWPETIPIFLKRQMGCIGCAMAPFETLAEAANIYGFCCTQFIKELQDGINAKT